MDLTISRRRVGIGCRLHRTIATHESSRKFHPATLRRISTAHERCHRKGVENVRQKSRVACWAILKETCKQQAVPTPSYTTFCLAVRQSNKFKQTLKRQGPRA